MYIILDVMYVTMSLSTGLCPDWDLWTANKLKLQLHFLPYHISEGGLYSKYNNYTMDKLYNYKGWIKSSGNSSIVLK
jgi:hypothetical protein